MKALVLGACAALGLALGACQRPATDVEVREDAEEGAGGSGWSSEAFEENTRPPVVDLNDAEGIDDEGTNYDLGGRDVGGSGGGDFSGDLDATGDARPAGDEQVNQPHERQTEAD